MKKTFFFLLTLAMTSITYAQTEIITNGSFEGLADDAQLVNNCEPQNISTFTSCGAHSIENESYVQPSNKSPALRHKLTVIDGTTYTVSFKTKRRADPTAADPAKAAPTKPIIVYILDPSVLKDGSTQIEHTTSLNKLAILDGTNVNSAGKVWSKVITSTTYETFTLTFKATSVTEIVLNFQRAREVLNDLPDTDYDTFIDDVSVTYTPNDCNVTDLTASGDNLQTTLNWTASPCSVDEVLVVAKKTTVTAAPIGDETAYTANAIFGSGTEIAPNEFVVYKGTGNTETITGLTNGTEYHFTTFTRTGTDWTTGVKTSVTPAVVVIPTIIITEIMNVPSSNDHGREYFEVYNHGTSIVNMHGWTINAGGDTHVISSDVFVPIGGFAVLGNDKIDATIDASNSNNINLHGVVLDYTYSTDKALLLDNDADSIELIDGDSNQVDIVAFGDGANIDKPSSNRSIVFTGLPSDDNNLNENWTQAKEVFGFDSSKNPHASSDNSSPNKGTPGNSVEHNLALNTDNAYALLSDNTWYPAAPSGDLSAITSYIGGNVAIAADVTFDKVHVAPKANLTINDGITLTANSVNLTSNTTEYPSLILNGTGTIVGTVTYKRHINGNSSGNDLISAPVTGQTFEDFATANTNIYNNTAGGKPTQKMFGPFNKANGTYTTWDSTTDAAKTLNVAVGYRAGSSDNRGFTFSGTPNKGTQNITIVNSGSGSAFAEWNLIGNPYPSYLNAAAFLNHQGSISGATNVSLMSEANGIYAFDGDSTDGWGTYNLTNVGTLKITPGQGFFVSCTAASSNIEFTQSMTTTGTDDDFILGKTASNTNLNLKLQLVSNVKTSSTEFYFIQNTSKGYDHGYDSAVFGSSANPFAIYSHLVNDSTGKDFAIQSLDLESLNDVTIPLGINTTSGKQQTVSIANSTLAESTNVYLNDAVANKTILLNDTDYTFTASQKMTTTGRFTITLSQKALSVDTVIAANNLEIYNVNSQKTIFINGVLNDVTKMNLFDLQGRRVFTKTLDKNNTSNKINVSNLNTGIYIALVQNDSLKQTKKIIIK